MSKKFSVDNELRKCERDRAAWRDACHDAERQRDAAIAERDRLRRELEELSGDARVGYWGAIVDGMTVGEYVSERIDAILRGES